MNIALFHDGSWFHKPLKRHWESKGHRVMACPNYSEWGFFKPDLLFFDMCTSNIVYFSNNRILDDFKVICRIHGIGIRSRTYKKIDWNNKVSGIIFINERLKNVFTENMPDVSIPMTVVNNGVDLDMFTLKKNFTPTYKLAFVGRWITMKGIDEIFNLVNRFKEIDSRYELHTATGQIPHNNMNDWLEDKDYLIHPSTVESFGYAVAEAMAKGIRPLINNWDGAIETFGEEFLIENWCLDSDPERFRGIIEKRYNQKRMLREIDKFCNIKE